MIYCNLYCIYIIIYTYTQCAIYIWYNTYIQLALYMRLNEEVNPGNQWAPDKNGGNPGRKRALNRGYAPIKQMRLITSRYGIRIQWFCHTSPSLTLGYSVRIPYSAIEHTVRLMMIASTCFYWNHKCSTWGGYRSSQSSNNYIEYATLKRPSKTETALLYSSSIFLCWITDVISGCRK